MIPYGHQNINQNDIKEVVKTLKSDWLTQGPKVLEFENALAGYCGARFAVACSNGTAALHLAYLAAGFKPGDEVITTPNTFAATANMILVVGAKVIFSDIRDDSYNLDEEKLKSLIEKMPSGRRKKLKAIVPVHFGGQPCAMEKISAIAKKYNLIVIEDACQALGAKYRGQKIGSCKKSHMAVFSFHPVKSITTGEGGAILTNNEKFYKKMLLLRNHGIYKDQKGKNVMVEMGFNYRITDLQTALGLSQMKKLDKFIKLRHERVRWYAEVLKNINNIILPVELPECYSAWHLYVIRVKAAKLRDDLVAYLKANGVGVNFHYPAVYSHPYYRKNGYKNFKLKNEENYENSCITLPLYTTLSKNEIGYIAKVINKFFSNL